MNQVRRIAVLMGLELSFSRAVVRGIREYALQRPGWLFRTGPTTMETLPHLKDWQPHGIIAGLYHEEFARRLLRLRKPVVDTGCCVEGLRVPVVDVDHEAVGCMAAEYFLARGFTRFGYFGIQSARYSRLREQSFCRRLASEGHAVSICYGDYLQQSRGTSNWRVLDRQAREWLKELPKPAAVFACNDIPARTLADTCGLLGLNIPGDVALLGVDNDDLECSLAPPPLSSIAIPGERIGFEAAKLLEAMMEGARRPPSVFLPPLHTVTRQSTDTMAVTDPVVAAALRFIREKAVQGINAESVVLYVGASRRELERKFRRILGCSLLDEVRRTRVEHAKRLLAGTALPMPSVARQSGFSTPQRFALVFRQFEKVSPTAYRRQVRG
ncbi:MAG: DNA-binding transcriptional regulator [Thermoguttaceae bacterium]|jgi:LacI family transcriptional regulator|nr:DNA-binding transcriptional regulator [Thermoguttaceae bacterium]